LWLEEVHKIKYDFMMQFHRNTTAELEVLPQIPFIVRGKREKREVE
jgi:hypothetical protein